VSKKTKLPSLEVSLTEISQLIDQMEKGNLTLEQSLEHFERGVHLIKHCQGILQEADQKIRILMEKNGSEQLGAYEEPEE